MKHGFSLIELMVVLSIISITAVFSISGLQQLPQTHALNHSFNALSNSLISASSTSLTTGIATIVCASKTSVDCDINGNWSNGWLIYHDNNQNLLFDDDERIIFTHVTNNSKLNINFNALSGGSQIVFYPTGRLFPNGNFVICHVNLLDSYKLTVSLSGRITPSEHKKTDCL